MKEAASFHDGWMACEMTVKLVTCRPYASVILQEICVA